MGAAFVTWHAEIGKAFSAVLAAVTGFGAAMYTSGAHVMGELARGIGSAAMAPVHAVEAMARGIRRYLPFSPAETGPLRDLHHVQVVQTIADTMKPAPVFEAMRRIAAAAAIAVPIMMTPTMASTIPLHHVAPALAAAAAPSLKMHGPGHASSAAPIIQNTVHVTVQHHGADSDLEGRVRAAVEEALDHSGYKLAQVLRREQKREDRLNF